MFDILNADVLSYIVIFIGEYKTLRIVNSKFRDLLQPLFYARYTIKYKGIEFYDLDKILHLKDCDDVLELSKLTNLRSLTFDSDFNQPVDNLPDTLTSLTFDSDFNQPVDKLPSTLTSLTFDHDFNQSVDNLPSTLKSLTFGWEFKQPVDNLPSTLKSLTFERKFNQPVDNLPDSVLRLSLRESYPKNLRSTIPYHIEATYC